MKKSEFNKSKVFNELLLSSFFKHRLKSEISPIGNIPKELIAEKRIEYFLKIREEDRQRMMQLRQQQLETLSIETQKEQFSSGGISK